MSDLPGTSENFFKCLETKRHRLEGYLKIKGQKVISDPYGYLGNYPDSIISFRKNGIYINKSFTKLLEHCKKNFPPMCWKNFKKYNRNSR